MAGAAGACSNTWGLRRGVRCVSTTRDHCRRLPLLRVCLPLPFAQIHVVFAVVSYLTPIVWGIDDVRTLCTCMPQAFNNGGFEASPPLSGWTTTSNQPDKFGWHLQSGSTSPVSNQVVVAPPEQTHAAMVDGEGPPGRCLQPVVGHAPRPFHAGQSHLAQLGSHRLWPIMCHVQENSDPKAPCSCGPTNRWRSPWARCFLFKCRSATPVAMPCPVLRRLAVQQLKAGALRLQQR